jgi:hypothetical protein
MRYLRLLLNAGKVSAISLFMMLYLVLLVILLIF